MVVEYNSADVIKGKWRLERQFLNESPKVGQDRRLLGKPVSQQTVECYCYLIYKFVSSG